MNLWKWLFDNRGEVAPPPDPAPAPASNGGDWRAPFISDTSLAPIVSKMTEPDLPSVLKSYDGLKSHMGKAVFVKDPKNADELKMARARAYELGLFPKPPESADKYDIKHDPNNRGLVERFRSVAFEEGLSQQAVEKIVNAFNEYAKEQAPALAVDNEKAAEALKAFAQEQRKEPAEIMEYADEFLGKLFADDEIGQKWLENPIVKQVLTTPSAMKLFGAAALNARQDSGEIGGGVTTANLQKGADAWKEHEAIVHDSNHPKFKLFWGGDKATQEYVNNLAKIAHPGEKTL